MANKQRGLGRGLDALLGMTTSPVPDSAAADSDQVKLKYIPVDLIQRGRYQPRIDMRSETLQELADSIQAQGIIQPIVVRQLEDGEHYEIIAGERRWRASQIAQLQEIPAIIRDVPDQAAMSIALIENIQREQLNPMEESIALHRLVNEFELTHQQVAEAVGRSRAAVSNLMRLMELTEDVKRMLEVNDIEMGHARALLGLDGDNQIEAAHQVVARGLSVRETEQLVKKQQKQANGEHDSAKTTKPDPNVGRLEQDLADKLGARVQIRQGAKGKGKLIIQYNSLDELDGILTHIK